MTDSDRRHVAAWLLACAALVFLIVLVGGITRLTRSGLSIVEWQPLIGTLPPLSDAEWQALFVKYRETPEYRLVNLGMDLEGFKRIFWWEYIHRLLARLIGLVFLVPLLWFHARKMLERPLAWKLWGIFALGALQGALGWLMVASGLVDDPKVSPVRLSLHLGSRWRFSANCGSRSAARPRTARAGRSPPPAVRGLRHGALAAWRRCAPARPTRPFPS